MNRYFMAKPTMAKLEMVKTNHTTKLAIGKINMAELANE
jgi:hypothetical protein